MPPQLAVVWFEEPPPAITPLRPLAPRLRWAPAVPGEGTLVALIVEPKPAGLPILEAGARAGDDDLVLAPLSGGGYLALVAAPRSVDEVPIEVTATFIDGTRLSEKLSLPVARREFPSTRLRVASRFTAPDEATLERVRRERELVRKTLSSATESPLWRGLFTLPLEGKTTSPYGERRLFNSELRSQHTGLDIRGDTGDPVRAANSGRVALSRELFFNGQAVFIDHGLGLYTGYFHLSKREVGEGQWVEKGELIGRVGATGRVTGRHLHWALYANGIALDPLSLLDQELARALGELATPGAPPAPQP
jgi:murein DD-endopeptidase MepM/ murein hydrolase activator NlpD